MSSSTIRITVGTMNIRVTAWRLHRAIRLAGDGSAVWIIVAPTASPIIMKPMPAMWKLGMADRPVSSRRQSSHCGEAS